MKICKIQSNTFKKYQALNISISIYLQQLG